MHWSLWPSFEMPCCARLLRTRSEGEPKAASVKLPDSKDFWSGIMLIAIGGGALIIGHDYPFGTALRMGAGFFPLVLGAALVLFGVFFAMRGLHSHDRIEGNWSPRALIILPVAFVAFGLLMQHAGFVPALFVLVVGSAAAGTEFRLVEVLLLAAFLTALGVAVFVWALGLPYPLFSGS
jgi:Tripartite tricarboxylate transporter TctB family